jgi:Flp pilus assembly pilin Flp
MISTALKRLVLEEDGMEMVEWAIVGVVFAVACAVFWGTLAGNVDAALNSIETTVNPGGGTGTGGTGTGTGTGT